MTGSPDVVEAHRLAEEIFDAVFSFSIRATIADQQEIADVAQKVLRYEMVCKIEAVLRKRLADRKEEREK